MDGSKTPFKFDGREHLLSHGAYINVVEEHLNVWIIEIISVK